MAVHAAGFDGIDDHRHDQPELVDGGMAEPSDQHVVVGDIQLELGRPGVIADSFLDELSIAGGRDISEPDVGQAPPQLTLDREQVFEFRNAAEHQLNPFRFHQSDERVRHLLDLEQARLALRGDLGLAVDRGRIVRESLAIIIADLEAKGDQSIIARRLRGR